MSPIKNIYNKFSPFQRVIIALLLGIASGIFIGEPAGQIEILGNIYISLLQMTVLPYVLVSIIGGLGRLNRNMATTIGSRAVKIILVIWLAVMTTLLFLPLAYPNWETGGFFSSSMVAEPTVFNFIKLYIPANIFSSLSETIVPAVVLFSLLMGVALIQVKNKETFLTLTTNISDSLMKVASYVTKLAPLGIFAISASAAGTLEVEELGRLQVFLWVYITAAALLAFVLLPLLIHWATPFSYREVLSTAGEAMITAIATGSVLVVLPMIIDRSKELLKKHNMECEETDSTVDVLVPTAYSFPNSGTLLGLGFVLFSAWYVGTPLGLDQYFSFVTMGALTAFGKMAIAIPFLLDFYDLPADQFQLYLLGSVVTARFAVGLAALHGFVVTLLVASAVIKRMKWHRFFQAIAVHLTITFGVMIVVGMLLKSLIPYKYEGVQTFESLKPMVQPAITVKKSEIHPLTKAEQNEPRLDIILARGNIRIGYFDATLPYAFRNSDNQMVGFDVEIINELAKDLGVKTNFLHIKDKKDEATLLANGSVDITIGGKIITPLRALKVAFSDSYTHHTAGLLLNDSKRDSFSDLYDIKEMKNLNLAVGNSKYYKDAIKEYFPNAKLTEITNIRKYLKGHHNNVDALVFSAEAGSAWTMLYPSYSTVIPKGMSLRAPVGFSLPKGQLDYVAYINTWLKLKQDNGFQQKVYDYWILGKNPKAKKPRWSIMKDVLGWY
ncbi:cation:dicarboxylate symporter family transporter [Colwellia sp. RSH04]|uniref:cation:dicarboxylate symporter family transporter n=1 Tax=Colwellia sp. RSH04 TaxID=2305464 RepID=UPI000E58042D|nr:cation:dicarboxylase symporter family transporter [Colwellia sp. RSH04]RHW77639.1 sodium:dicarboxylate symporter [Colwellia sp. RSH04]